MPLLVILFVLFLYIYCEVSLLITVGSVVGALPLICLLICVSLIGMWLIRLRGVMTIWQIRSQISKGKIPTQAVISSLFFIISGILLIIPGLLSDILAILLLLPITQKVIQGVIVKYFCHKFQFTVFDSSSFGNKASDENIFEAEFERQQDENKRIK